MQPVSSASASVDYTRTAPVMPILRASRHMKLFCILLFLPDRVSYINQLTYIEYEASNVPPLRSKLNLSIQ